MVDRITTSSSTTMGNDNDDWEVAVDTGEFDKRLEQQEKARAANQVIFLILNRIVFYSLPKSVRSILN
ncbi:unnamed protein product [Adineta steineri]|uniref:Uncharacterized protein n=1 Tax=Adineta steineri TaxID=433720 RepID=A0A820RVY9_9BILA|nr:unnamed protein product [Adineta steineri]